MTASSPLTIWIWRDCEPLPFDPDNPRLMRAGMLATQLAEAGHKVRWFNSTFNHYQKCQRTQRPGTHVLADGLILELLDGPGYDRNTSPKRFIHNWLVAKRAVNRASQIVQQGHDKPDLMVLDMPMPEMALRGVRLAEQWKIPSLVSVRDLWPDFFENFLSPVKAQLARPIIAKIDHEVKEACREATSIVGISEGYLDWALLKAGRERRESDAILPLGYSRLDLDTDQHRARGELEHLGIDYTKSLVCFIGSWGKTYDLEFLLDTAALLDQRSDIQFIIAGDGEQAGSLGERMERQANVICPGWLNRNQIAQLMHDSDVAIAPYRTDSPQGMPNKLFEYMSAGLFQVVSLRGEGAELLQKENLGITVDMQDPHSAATAISNALKCHANEVERTRIQKYFNQNFDAGKIYVEYQKHIERLVGQHSNKTD